MMTASTPAQRHEAHEDAAMKAAATRAARAVEKQAEQLLDVSEVLETMRRCARQLDEMLQRRCEAHGDGSDAFDGETGRGDDEEVAIEVFGEENKTDMTASAYFAAVREALEGGKRLTPGQIRRLIVADATPQSVDMTATVYAFAVTSSQDCDDEGDGVEWETTERMTPQQLEQRVARSLLDADPLMPAQLATRVAQVAVNDALPRLINAQLPMKAVEAMFPPVCGVSESPVEWRSGNGVCKLRAYETAACGKWGVQLTASVECVARARAPLPTAIDSRGDPAAFEFGPPVRCVSSVKLLAPKTWYGPHVESLEFEPQFELSLAAIPEQEKEKHEDQVSGEPSGYRLPEFMTLYHWGGHAVPTDSTSGDVAPPKQSHDQSLSFQRLEIHLPLPRNRIVQVACGRVHTLLRNDIGLVFSYGHAVDGALGHGDAWQRDHAHVTEPKLIEFFFDNSIAVEGIACGGDDFAGYHSAAVTKEGGVYTWGVGPALGIGSIQTKSLPTVLTVPMDASHQSGSNGTPKIVDVACGSGFCVALRADGVAFAWGKWSDGRLGLGSIPVLHKPSRQNGGRRQLQRFQLYPKRLISGEKWKKVSCGDAHCVALTRNGRVFVWGRGAQGQLGLGDTKDALSPVALPSFLKSASTRRCRDVAAAQDWSMAVDSRGSVWSWGACGASVLGLTPQGEDLDRSAALADLLLQKHRQLRQQQQSTSATTREPEPLALRFHWLRPQEIPSLSLGDVSIRSVSAGARHAAAISEHGDLYVWGSPSSGHRPVPTLVTSSSASSGSTDIGGTIVERVFCGGSQTVVLTSGSFLARAMQGIHSVLSVFNEKTNSPDELPNAVRATGVDVALIFGGGHTLLAHKIILARRSPVLRELIVNEQLPRPVDQVHSSFTLVTELLLPQIRVDIGRIVLEFLYTDNITTSLDPLSFVVRDLLRAARVLRIHQLVRICQERIASASYVPLGTPLAGMEEEEAASFAAEDGHSLTEDLAFAFSDATWSDLRLVADDRAIPVHRCLLIARSEYFRGLLAFYDQQKPAERPMSELVVDESYASMLRVLHFIYNDELTTLTKTARSPRAEDEVLEADEEEEQRTEQLLGDLIAADRYGLARMKRLCEHHIKISEANCLDVLVVADLVHASHLKRLALAFVRSHLHLLSSSSVESPSSALDRLTHEFPHLLEELFEIIKRHSQQQALLRDWQKRIEAEVRAQQEQQKERWDKNVAETTFPWVPMMLAFVFATLYLAIMNAHETDYPVVPATNLVALGALLAAAFLGKI